MIETTVTTTEAARRAGVSTDTIRRWARLGYLHPIRIGPGRRYRIDPDELASFIGGDYTGDVDQHSAEVSK
jgi:excisionase family DNA binding protein